MVLPSLLSHCVVVSCEAVTAHLTRHTEDSAHHWTGARPGKVMPSEGRDTYHYHLCPDL